MITEDARPGHRPATFTWTLVLFMLGGGLCAGSYLLFQDFGHREQAVVQPLDGSDRLLVGDPAVTGSRTISRFEYFAPQYLGDLAPWLGGIGLATIVANVFRLAGFEMMPRRSVNSAAGRRRSTSSEPLAARSPE